MDANELGTAILRAKARQVERIESVRRAADALANIAQYYDGLATRRTNSISTRAAQAAKLAIEVADLISADSRGSDRTMQERHPIDRKTAQAGFTE